MTNREWLNSLSNEDYNKKLDVRSDEMCDERKCKPYEDDTGHVNCKQCQLDWLGEERAEKGGAE